MNRSHVVALLITVFALAVLGVAAGTLESAHPANPNQAGSADTPVTFHEQEGKAKQTDSPGGQPIINLVFPETDVTNGLDSSAQPGSALSRLGVGVALLVVGAILVLWRLTSDDSHTDVVADDELVTPVDEPEPYTPVADARDVPPTNDVYRAWQAMVSSLGSADKPHETPTKLAQTAIQAGFPASDVHSITEVFCAVRYGGTSPTNEREQRARDAFASIRQADGYSTGSGSSTDSAESDMSAVSSQSDTSPLSPDP
ncbi:DUF4129 domain-containing protein (plasmid) [Haloferax mediterranei ATCC 33500]|uniref:DUF4129 domain-containing protein n=1 Tax=Haloferax mediterranei (strain ATCC 33500 / DSM 1411 / JCM 8866 / NBRC 14739 / NCIMB 2177 / R-4) TaxID=523841 RepID=I3RA29_HALMT|nr:DUF4129 domain-containing protein [Haloferax mediterranei]AFK21089.1 hypothetical protein HFX_5257 [Haloferax mediterranei ATCC 33500]AHZ24322.1 hypothetical protein BM92_19175 [Haloferax mediterranei ATCC 33500]EMA05408.1 hypothetical protein C439_01375 [Haloferax mediterranei ATCC 33500]MDX5989794.1 DUF4129 domain-containing protein [Haloferax mediterranei ATCC 33500]QCQ77238.1 DUF4129 domain-containing protein [Haloferax mediterranei ATCC 33500]